MAVAVSWLTAIRLTLQWQHPAAAASSGVLEGKSLQELAAAAEAPRLFIVDYWAVYDLLDQLETANAGSNRVMHAGRCVLFR